MANPYRVNLIGDIFPGILLVSPGQCGLGQLKVQGNLGNAEVGVYAHFRDVLVHPRDPTNSRLCFQRGHMPNEIRPERMDLRLQHLPGGGH